MASDYSLLINFEDGVIRDNSPQAHTITPAGTPEIDTAIMKFGAASGKFDADADQLTIPEHASFNFGSGDFTIDFWFRSSDGSALSVNPWKYGVDSDNLIDIQFFASVMQFRVRASASNEVLISTAHGIDDDTWHHVAVVRSDDDWSMYVDGTRIDTDSVTYTVPDFGASVMTFAPRLTALTNHIDHFRILKGRAAWTGASFTVPTRPYLEFIEEGLTQKLLNESGVFDEVGNSIFPEIAPHGTAAPYIVMSKVSGTHEHVLGGTAGLVFNRIQLDMWSDTIRGSRIIADEVRKAIDGYSGVMGNLYAQHCIMEDEGTEVEFGEKNREQRAFGVRQDYIIAHSE